MRRGRKREQPPAWIEGNPQFIMTILAPLSNAAKFVMTAEQWPRHMAWVDEIRQRSGLEPYTADEHAGMYRGLEQAVYQVDDVIRRLPGTGAAFYGHEH